MMRYQGKTKYQVREGGNSGGNRDEVETGTKRRTGTDTRTGIGTGTGAKKGTRIERGVEGRKSPGTCYLVRDSRAG